jgi:hypothetical protein
VEFYGTTYLQIGLTEKEDKKKSDHNHKRGRKETFNIPEGHELLGCVILADEIFMRGI